MENIYKILIDKTYYDGADFCKMQKMNYVLEEHFKVLCIQCPDLYKSTIEKMMKVVYEINIEQAKHIVKERFGEKWSYETILNVLSENNINDSHILFYIEMNKHYFKNKNTAKLIGKEEDVSFYLSLSKDSIYEKNTMPFHIEQHYL